MERCIGRLKGKWRRLLKLEMHDLDRLPLVVFCCCLLHNFVLNGGPLVDGVVQQDVPQRNRQDANEDNRNLRAGQQKREDIRDHLDMQRRV